MADARREHEYDVAVATVCYFGQAWNGKFRPGDANPYREGREVGRVKTREEREEDSKEGWALLREGLRQLAGQRGG